MVKTPLTIFTIYVDQKLSNISIINTNNIPSRLSKPISNLPNTAESHSLKKAASKVSHSFPAIFFLPLFFFFPLPSNRVIEYDSRQIINRGQPNEEYSIKKRSILRQYPLFSRRCYEFFCSVDVFRGPPGAPP